TSRSTSLIATSVKSDARISSLSASCGDGMRVRLDCSVKYCSGPDNKYTGEIVPVFKACNASFNVDMSIVPSFEFLLNDSKIPCILISFNHIIKQKCTSFFNMLLLHLFLSLFYTRCSHRRRYI